MLLDVAFVVTIHDEVLKEFEGGLPGLAGGGLGAIEAALTRINNHAFYAGLDDVLGIAALYAEAIARGHVFNDGNKRTALLCALAYLKRQDIDIPRDKRLEDATVALASGEWDHDEYAFLLGEMAALALGVAPDDEGMDEPDPQPE